VADTVVVEDAVAAAVAADGRCMGHGVQGVFMKIPTRRDSFQRFCDWPFTPSVLPAVIVQHAKAIRVASGGAIGGAK
jgi:hypothetical protein